AQFFDQCSVSLQVVLLEIGEEPPPSPDELEQAAARVVVLRMRPQMLGQVVDALCEKRDLDLRRPRVRLARPMPLDDPFLHFLRESHSSPSSRQSQQSAGSRRKAAAASRDRVAIHRALEGARLDDPRLSVKRRHSTARASFYTASQATP